MTTSIKRKEGASRLFDKIKGNLVFADLVEQVLLEGMINMRALVNEYDNGRVMLFSGASGLRDWIKEKYDVPDKEMRWISTKKFLKDPWIKRQYRIYRPRSGEKGILLRWINNPEEDQPC